MKDYIKHHKISIYFMIIVIAQIIVSTIFFINRGALFADEILNFMLTNEPTNTYYLHNLSKLDTWWTQEDLINQLAVEEIFNYKNVIYQQMADCHPPLYYLILHTMFSVLKPFINNNIDIGNGFNILAVAFILNIIIFIFTQIFVYKTSKIICEDKNKAIIAVLVYGFTAGSISNVILLRMYSLLTLWVVISVYLHVRLMQETYHGDNIITATRKELIHEHVDFKPSKSNKTVKKLILLTLLTTFLGGMTHYYFYIFQCFMVVTFSFYNIKYITHAVKHLMVVVLNVIVWLATILHVLNTQHFREMKDAMTQSAITRFLFFVDFVNIQLFCRTGIIILIAIIIVYVLAKKKKIKTNNTLLIYLSIPTIASLAVISRIASFVGDKETYLANQSDHYIYMLYPIIIMIIVNYFLKYNVNKYIICGYMMIISILSYSNYDLTVDWMYSNIIEYKELMVENIPNTDAIVITDGAHKGDNTEDEDETSIYGYDLNIYELMLMHDKVFFTHSSEEIKQELSKENNIKYIYIAPGYIKQAETILNDITQASGKKTEFMIIYGGVEIYSLK